MVIRARDETAAVERINELPVGWSLRNVQVSLHNIDSCLAVQTHSQNWIASHLCFHLVTREDSTGPFNEGAQTVRIHKTIGRTFLNVGNFRVTTSWSLDS
jgi:hypothetical protein